MTKRKKAPTTKTAPRRKRATITAVQGHRVRLIREKRGWTQQVLSVETGLHTAQLSRIERGQKDILSVQLLRLASALGCSTDYLLGLTDDPAPARKR